MSTPGARTPYFIPRYHDHIPPATLDELLRVSAKHESTVTTADEIGEPQQDLPKDDAADDSDSDYEATQDEEDSDDDFDGSEPEVDEWRLHAAEPREDLYVHEMRNQRGRMDEKESQWVRGYMKAQRMWKSRTGRSIDEFNVPHQSARRMQKTRSFDTRRPRQALEDDEEGAEDLSMFTGVTQLESLLLLAAAVFVCLSLAVQLVGRE